LFLSFKNCHLCSGIVFDSIFSNIYYPPT
jgi:hypothetical protein